VSDAGVAAILADASVQSAALNVKINVNSIKDAALTKDMVQDARNNERDHRT
jgi:formiminotetrahydrofolate cyclodeaminase